MRLIGLAVVLSFRKRQVKIGTKRAAYRLRHGERHGRSTGVGGVKRRDFQFRLSQQASRCGIGTRHARCRPGARDR